MAARRAAAEVQTSLDEPTLTNKTLETGKTCLLETGFFYLDAIASAGSTGTFGNTPGGKGIHRGKIGLYVITPIGRRALVGGLATRAKPNRLTVRDSRVEAILEKKKPNST
mmetsp:Transcript_31051/g.96064  ORF Transcript_31051/g.96064 Transcript_31051/m.96064 type:complete len:111 (-) Transcript_31051:1436-1768(-)